MAKVLLSYASVDSTVADRLRSDLKHGGYEIWQDIELAPGEMDWKNHAREAIRTVDAVLVLLTPAAVDSYNVTWQWETALTLETPVISLIIASCIIPVELAGSRYYDLSNTELYSQGLMALNRDLMELEQKKQEEFAKQSGSKYVIHHMEGGSTAGDNATTINYGSSHSEENLLVRLAATDELIRDHFVQLQKALQAVQDRLTDNHQQELEHISRLVRTNELDYQDMQLMMESLYQIIKGIEAGQMQLDLHIRKAVNDLNPILRSDLSLQHRLELTLPIIPFILDYKYELGTGAGADLNPAFESLFNLWDRLRRRR